MAIYKKRLLVLIIYILIFIMLLFQCTFGGVYDFEFIVLLIGYLFVGGLLCNSICFRNADVFEPIIFIYLLWICLFSIAPIILTVNGYTSIDGVDFMSGCVKGTLIYMFAAIAFYVGYYTQKGKKEKLVYSNLVEGALDKNNILKLMIVIWAFSWGIGIWHEVFAMGRGFSYILTLGQYGEVSSSAALETPVAFLRNFSYSAIIPWLYIMIVSRSILLKSMITVCTLALYVLCGWRFILLIMGLSLITVYYVNRNKRPNALVMVSILVIALTMFTLIGNARNDLRSGRSFQWEFSETTFTYMLETNLNIYQPYYAVVNHFPSEHMFTFGEGMIFDTAITFIPRAVWPEKPLSREFASLRAIRYSLGDKVIDHYKMAMPNLGEIYVDFGSVGIIALMFAWGRFLGKCTKMYQGKQVNFEKVVVYSVIYALSFQFVTRGYLPANFYLAIFVLWPGLLLLYLTKGRNSVLRIKL